MSERFPPAAPGLRRLLDLLADDAPAEEFSTVLAEARAGGADPGELAEVERATATALHIRRTLHNHRRRETELAALFDTAGDLAALRDLDAVLKSIVRRARMLLGTATAYLTLPDEEAGDTYMRVTDGSVSAVFQNLRLELGEGLGGLVAQTARPYATPDYPTDRRFRHTRTIDAGVTDEGLVAILGVPLLLGSRGSRGGKVIGVLFAADRTPRSFTADEVALLSSLAAHAAIAIDTAAAIADSRAALAGLAEANEVIRAHSAAMHRAAEAHDRLTDLVLRGGDLPEVAAEVARLLGGAITIHDPEGRTLAAVDPDGSVRSAGGVSAAQVVAATGESLAAGRAVYRGSRLTCAVLAGPRLLGSLVLQDRPDLDDPGRRLFERAGVVTALLLLLRHSVTEAEIRVRGELIADLLAAPDRDPAALVGRGHRLGIDLNRPHHVLVAQSSGCSREKLAGAATQYLFGGHGISADQSGATVLLLADDGRTPGESARGASAQLGQLVGTPVTVAAAGPAAGPRAIAAAYAEATRCLRAMRALGRSGEGADALELGFVGVLLGDAHDVTGFVRAMLGTLLDYDDRRSTALVRTLDAYFSCGGSLTRTKDVLHVHVNTVVQRLDRVQALLGPDWNSPERALELRLALRLHSLTAEG